MNEPWLLLDCNFLCYRAYHAIGDRLTFMDEPTSVVYGFLKDAAALMDEFQTRRVVFAFDRGCGKRRQIDPEYKAGRDQAHADDTEEEQRERREFLFQVRRLRQLYLPKLGYRNVFSEEGYEADDVIASVVEWSLGEEDSAVIVSSDQDLWQLVRERVVCYNPRTRRVVDRDGFVAKWGIEPPLWAHVKALAGCPGDGVVGLRGIGEVTAAKWFRAVLKPTTEAYRKINEGLHVHNRNLPLVRLPFDGCPVFKLREDEVTPERWQELAERLGMRSLRDAVPGMPRGVKRNKGRGFGL